MQIKRIVTYSKKVWQDVNALMVQWSNKGHIDQDYLKKVIRENYLIGLYDGNTIVGMVTVINLYKVSGLKGSIEHLILDERYRGAGWGKKLIQEAMKIAKKAGMKDISLTCEPHRKAANALYKKIGFTAQDSIFYRKNLK